MVVASNLGFPRIGVKRDLKKAIEAFWKGEQTENDLQNTAKSLRSKHWQMQKNAGISLIPVNDFSFYDHVLDTIALLGAVPARYGFSGGNVDLKTYFAMARGAQGAGLDVPAMEMTKWFDTNYHYIVPEFSADQSFALSSDKIFSEVSEAKAQGFNVRPVLLGPVSFLTLGKTHGANFDKYNLLEKLLPVYKQILEKLSALGVEWVQIDEPCLVQDLSAEAKTAYSDAYAALASGKSPKLLLTTYFGDLRDNLELAVSLPVAGLHVDLVRAPQQLHDVLAKAPKDFVLSLGVVDGRNIWKNNFAKSLEILRAAAKERALENLLVAPSCSLLHSPVDLSEETALDSELKNWLAFAAQKVAEVAVLTKALSAGDASVGKELSENAAAHSARGSSTRIHNQEVKKRVADTTAAMSRRESPYAARRKAQESALGLPLLPTTTIGSFPQTAEVRKARADFKAGTISAAEYDRFLEKETINAIKIQERLDIDMLVHGEFERNDMVEYFGEQLSGFAFTKNGWVQSYGSRCVKPPVIFGDVARPKPMTIDWTKFAQDQTKRIMKGMLTGPITILQWSFVRDDQPRETTCRQIAFAIRDEVNDLEKAGIKAIQVDEPAVREGLPLRRSDWNAYLAWAVESFRISTAGVRDETQIHTHMCYSEFNDIISSIADMDADVISIETSRSQMELLDAFVNFKYPNEIGPGVYDIHSPRVPSRKEMEDLLRKALKVLAPEQIWVNPDCGLKTRGWKEVEHALQEMVDAAKTLRAELKNKAA